MIILDIRAVPALSGSVNPQFLKDSQAVIMLCDNLLSFVCTPNVLSHYIGQLQSRVYLDSIRVKALLKTDESSNILQLNRLRHLTLDSATWNVIDILPTWSKSLQGTLRTLTLYLLKDLDSSILEPVLKTLPRLTALHVVSCRKVDTWTLLQLTRYTPLVQSLAFTCWTHSSFDPSEHKQLPDLRHLAVDFQIGSSTYLDAKYASLFLLTKSWGCALSALTIKFSSALMIPDTFMKPLLRTHGSSLTHLSMINCLLLEDYFRRVAHRCKKLERLAVIVPHKSIEQFATGLSRSSTLQTLQDLSTESPSLSKDSVRKVMQSVPSLQKIITLDRIWTRHRQSNPNDRHADFIPEKKHNPRPNHWFIASV
ncbi:hypothetical protein QCA50_013088 [Cerrena zonata]|uniref:Uncharacterized protein n=1 Tax=Cerrena zonata TaxID=2478898 RepID=A0AAW0G2C2_9APHY